MLPMIAPGDHLLIDPSAYREAPPSLGDVVMVRHPFHSERRIVKRVAGVTGTGQLDLRGDNLAESTDSRSFGAVPSALLLGRVVHCFPTGDLP